MAEKPGGGTRQEDWLVSYQSPLSQFQILIAVPPYLPRAESRASYSLPASEPGTHRLRPTQSNFLLLLRPWLPLRLWELPPLLQQDQ